MKPAKRKTKTIGICCAMANYSLNHAINQKTNPVELTFAKTSGTVTEDREKFGKIGQQLTFASSGHCKS